MQITVDFDKHGQRIDKFLQDTTEQSRARCQKSIERDLIFVNGKKPKKNYKVQEGDVIDIEFFTTETLLRPKEGELEIVFENENFFVINKQQGLTVHPSPENLEQLTLVNILMHHNKELSTIGAPFRPGLVHRLDKDTSGLMLIAKNDKTHYALQEVFANRTIKKHYQTLVIGTPRSKTGTINAALKRDPLDPTGMQISIAKDAKHAVTHFELIESFYNKKLNATFSLLDILIETGRTHQIRVHLRTIDLPIAGDQKYGNRKINQQLKAEFDIDKQILQAYKLEFELYGEKYSFELPPTKETERIKE